MLFVLIFGYGDVICVYNKKFNPDVCSKINIGGNSKIKIEQYKILWRYENNCHEKKHAWFIGVRPWTCHILLLVVRGR